MKTFIRVAEVWYLNKERNALEFGTGLYGPLQDFGRLSEQTRFAWGEGLPGAAWAAGHPIILKQFDPANFKRTDAAKEAGLTCGIALPIFAGDYLLAVIVFFCGDDEDHVGAIELWHNDIEDTYDLGLVDGYYGTAELFEWTSKHTKFRPGYGLPGGVWKSKMPQIVEDLGKSHRFLRADDAVKVGINRGLGIPCAQDARQTYVLTFMSALGTPIARRFEIWVPNEKGDALIFREGHCDQTTQLAASYTSVSISAVQDSQSGNTLGQVWWTGLPATCADLSRETSVLGQFATAAGLTSMLAIPIIQEGRLKAIVTMYF